MGINIGDSFCRRGIASSCRSLLSCESLIESKRRPWLASAQLPERMLASSHWSVPDSCAGSFSAQPSQDEKLFMRCRGKAPNSLAYRIADHDSPIMKHLFQIHSCITSSL